MNCPIILHWRITEIWKYHLIVSWRPSWHVHCTHTGRSDLTRHFNRTHFCENLTRLMRIEGSFLLNLLIFGTHLTTTPRNFHFWAVGRLAAWICSSLNSFLPSPSILLWFCWLLTTKGRPLWPSSPLKRLSSHQKSFSSPLLCPSSSTSKVSQSATPRNQ